MSSHPGTERPPEDLARLQLEVDVLRRAGVRLAHAPLPLARLPRALVAVAAGGGTTAREQLSAARAPHHTELAVPEIAVPESASFETAAPVRSGPSPVVTAPIATPTAAPPPDPTVESRQRELDALHERIKTCTACKLCEQRTLAVPGEGRLDPPILFVGEGPGAEEDRSGRPFVGPAGQLLSKMIAAIGLDRSEVFIANIVKCRPPANRIPEPDEVRACRGHLDRQIELLRPRTICTLGAPSTKALVPSVQGITAARGRQFEHRGIPLIPTFHPAYLLRQPSGKRAAWEDLKKIARLALGREF